MVTGLNRLLATVLALVAVPRDVPAIWPFSTGERNSSPTVSQKRAPTLKGMPNFDFSQVPGLNLSKCPTGAGGKKIVARVNGREITAERLVAEVRVAGARQNASGAAQKAGWEGALSQPVLDSLIQRSLIEEYADQHQIVVSNAMVDALIRKENAQLPPGRKLEDDAIHNGQSQDDLRYTIRSRELLRLVREHIGTGVQPATTDTLMKFVQNNPVVTTRSEEIRASHILLVAKDGVSTQLLETIRNKSEAVHAELESGLDFAEAARKYSQDYLTAARGGDLGYFTRGKMYANFDAAAFALQPGNFTRVIKTPIGFHIIKVTDRRPDNAQEAYRQEEARRAFDQWMAKALKSAKVEKYL
ncbi:MAG: peptidylprolyl isomerase [Candidatus Sumerlaeaceae bacterium]|nr:peptidylprolyl isomerase [Candidatus Sumerlaeaceae bacterium]